MGLSLLSLRVLGEVLKRWFSVSESVWIWVQDAALNAVRTESGHLLWDATADCDDLTLQSYSLLCWPFQVVQCLRERWLGFKSATGISRSREFANRLCSILSFRDCQLTGSILCIPMTSYYVYWLTRKEQEGSLTIGITLKRDHKLNCDRSEPVLPFFRLNCPVPTKGVR